MCPKSNAKATDGMRTLLVLNHAPDYREPFLRELGKQLDLTVLAQPCGPDGLSDPDSRKNYKYIEKPSRKFRGLLIQPGLAHVIRESNWDLVCTNMNMRNMSLIASFMTNRCLWNKWVWWGPIYRRRKNKVFSAIRDYMIKKAAFCLTYSKPVAEELNKRFGLKAASFNNTEILEDEFREGKFDEHDGVRLLFVGRNQPRKRLDRLVDLAERRKDVQVRLVGPGMEELSIPQHLITSGRVEVFGRTIGEALISHFDWADLVANPGHAGLLVMNAARHGKGIVIDSESEHAPEYFLAEEAGQPFIRFDRQTDVDEFIQGLITDSSRVKLWGKKLQEKARKDFTIEHMVKVHLHVFWKVAAKN